MVQKIVTPEKMNFNMDVSLPSEYVGKEVHVLFYIDEEVKHIATTNLKKNKPSDFFGTLSEENGEKMHEYVINSRLEWNKDI